MSASLKNLKPWKPGQSGNPSGKPKAPPKMFANVDVTLKELGKDPVKAIMELIPKLRDYDQVRVWLELMPYCHVKAQPATEVADPLEGLSDEELWQLIEAKKPKVSA